MRKPLSVLLVAALLFVTVPSFSQSRPNILEDGTPVRLRLTKTISSADAHVDERVDFEVLEDVKAGNLTVIKQGTLAWATVTQAEPKRRMGKGGKLQVNIDGVKLVDGTKIPLRGVKDVQGGGHTGAMTGAMVGTAIVFWPAAPFFLFMKGKDITVPKGHEVTVYVNGDRQFDTNSIIQASAGQAVGGTAVANTGGVAGSTLAVASTPVGADIEIDGNYVGSTPSSVSVAPGNHTIIVKKSGFRPWQRKIQASGGNVNVNADLERAKH